MRDEANKPENNSSIDPQVLGKMLVIQAALQAVPTPESLAEFLCRGLEMVPGTRFAAVQIIPFVKISDEKYNGGVFENDFCKFCDREFTGENANGFSTPGKHHDTYFCIRIQTMYANYGCLFFEKSDDEKFAPYQPFLENLANTVALTLEVRNHESSLKQVNEELLHTKDGLEILVQERTKDLVLKNEELQRWAHIFEHAEWGITVGSADGKTFELMNPAFSRMHGYTVDELKGQPLLIVFAPEVRADVPVNIQLTHEKGHHVWEAIHLRKDGSRFPALMDVTAVRDEQGKILYRVVNVQDITDRKRAEDALRQSEGHYRILFESNPHPMWVYDIDTFAFLTVNDAAITKYGYSRDEFLGMTIKDIRPEEDIARLIENVNSVSEGLDEAGYWRHRKKDGTIIDVEIVSHTLIYEGKHAELVLANDITKRKQAEEALQESEERLRAVVQTANDAIVTVDARGAIVAWNAAAEIIFGFSEDEMLGKPVTRIMPEQFHETHRRGVERALTSAERRIAGKTVEVVGLAKDGREFPIEISLAEWKTPTGNFFTAIIRDITERKQTEDQIRQMNSELEQRVEERARELRKAHEQLVRQEKLAVVGQLAGGMGHELRNPLGVISNAVYFLKMVLPDAGDKIKEYLNIIEKETRASEKIVTDLLDFARIASAQQAHIPVPELVRQTLERFPAPASVDVSLDLPADLPPVYADANHVTQILSNLTINAYQSMTSTDAKGGKFTISAGLQGDMIAIAVRDTGAGISPEAMQKIFEPHFLIETKGIGLEMAINKKLAEANGGWIEAQSKVGVGSTFTLWLPLSQKTG